MRVKTGIKYLLFASMDDFASMIVIEAGKEILKEDIRDDKLSQVYESNGQIIDNNLPIECYPDLIKNPELEVQIIVIKIKYH